jgi:O-antigen/teichoic acid export membrane protein
LQGLIKKAFLLGIAGLVVVLLVGPVLSSFLKIDSRVDMLVLAAIIALSFLPPATSGVLQGRQEFGWLSAVNISTFFPKLVSAIVFLRLGYGVNGALAGVAIGLAAAFLVSIMPIRSYMTPWNGGKDYNFKELYLYSLPAVIVMVCLAVPSNLDVVLARHFFTSKEAGLYAAAAVVGKIVLFLPGAISVVMFPKASKMCVQGGDSISLLNKSLICTAMLSGSAALVFIALPGIMVSIFGTVFAGSTSLAGLYAALMFVFTLVWVIAQYSLAARGSGFAVIMAIFTILELATISVLHSSPEEWILALILVNSLLFLSGYVMVTQARGVGH